MRRGFAPGFVNYKKGCTRLAAASDKVYQLLAHGRWFSLGSPASSTTKPGRHDIAEILLKVALSTINQIKSYICTHRSISHHIKLNYNILIEKNVLSITILHRLLEIWPIDISLLKNPHPLINRSGYDTTQSYIWKLVWSTVRSNQRLQLVFALFLAKQTELRSKSKDRLDRNPDNRETYIPANCCFNELTL
jgi:hypothetical protein